MEKKYGSDTLISLMDSGRKQVLNYRNEFPNRILVPEEVSSPVIMLNSYSYQKGAWVLHMLRKEVGDDIFFKILKDFYKKYKYSNANTDDFIRIANKDSKKNINLLLEPWLYTSDLPEYKVHWEFKNGKVTGKIIQTQEGSLFINNVYLLINYPNIPVLKKISINSKNQSFEFNSTISPTDIVVDPHSHILKGE